MSSQPDYIMGRQKDRWRFKKVGFRLPRHHDSDHRAIIANIIAGPKKAVAKYEKRRRRFPVKLQRMGPRTQAEETFEILRRAREPQPARERTKNAWISTETWKLINKRAQIQREGKMTVAHKHRCGREVNASLKRDR